MTKKKEEEAAVATPNPFETFKVGNTIDRGLSFLIYGDPGSGKTTLCSTLPVGETLMLNCESGIGPLLGTGHTMMNLLQKGDDLEIFVNDMYRYLRTQTHPFKYVAIDNLSELHSQLLGVLTRSKGKDVPELKEQGEVVYKLKDWVRLFRDLTYQNITVIFTAWQTPLEIKNSDGQVITQTFPMIGKTLAPQVCGLVDAVLHLEVHEKSGQRWLRTGISDQFISKCQFKGLNPVGEPADLPALISKIYSYDYTKQEGPDAR